MKTDQGMQGQVMEIMEEDQNMWRSCWQEENLWICCPNATRRQFGSNMFHGTNFETIPCFKTVTFWPLRHSPWKESGGGIPLLRMWESGGETHRQVRWESGGARLRSRWDWMRMRTSLMTRRRCRERRVRSLCRRDQCRALVACSAGRTRTPRPPCEPARGFSGLKKRRIFLFGATQVCTEKEEYFQLT